MRGKQTRGILELSGEALDAEINKILAKNPVNYRRWSAREDVILKRLFGQVTATVIAQTLGRSPASVNHRATELNLRGRK